MARTRPSRHQFSLAGILALVAVAGLVFAYLRPPSERESIGLAKAYLAKSGPAYRPDKVAVASTVKGDQGWLVVLRAGNTIVRVQVDRAGSCRTESLGIIINDL